jgi:hypothetical protein
LLTPFPGQDVDIFLVVGGALVVGDTTFSPLTGGLNTNEVPLDPPLAQILMMMQPLKKTPLLKKQMMK